ncbi:MAG: hypothetical protein ACP5DZ_08175 [Bacteroidales bacterium]
MDEISRDKLKAYNPIHGKKQKESKRARHFSNTVWKSIKSAMDGFIDEGKETQQMEEFFLNC